MIFIISSFIFIKPGIFSLEIKLTGFSWQMQCQCLPGLLNFGIQDPHWHHILLDHHVILFYLIRIFTWKLWSTVDLHSGSSHLHPRIFIKCHYALLVTIYVLERKFYSQVLCPYYWAMCQIWAMYWIVALDYWISFCFTDGHMRMTLTHLETPGWLVLTWKPCMEDTPASLGST